MTILVARHAETTKNVLQAHGRSPDCEITKRGWAEIDRLVAILRGQHPVSSVSYVRTPQAEATARLVAERSSLRLGRQISLDPYNLGRVAGLSERQLVERYPDVSRSLEDFRYRLTSLAELNLPDGEEPSSVCERIRNWADSELLGLDGHIVIASSSVITMIGNLSENRSLTPECYFNFPAATGSFRVFQLAEDAQLTTLVKHPSPMWPCTTYVTDMAETRGTALTVHHPAWELRDSLAVFIPGYFGNSRSGPYGLYSELARSLAYRGIESWTLDVPGSGDGAPVRRDWGRDAEVIRAIVNYAAQRRSTVLVIGHSMSAALAALAGAEQPKARPVALAPLVKWDQLRFGLLTTEQVTELRTSGWINRRGIDLSASYINSAEREWNLHTCHVARAILGGADTYAPPGSVDFPNERTTIVLEADHNFTNARAVAEVLETLLTLT